MKSHGTGTAMPHRSGLNQRANKNHNAEDPDNAKGYRKAKEGLSDATCILTSYLSILLV